MNESGSSSEIGGLTKSGYSVSANANFEHSTTPVCSSCTIINLNQNLRAQFGSFIAWGTQGTAGYKSTFPGSNANASTQYEGIYTFTFKFTVDGEIKTVAVNGPALLDTGTPNSVFLRQKGILQELAAQGLNVKENGIPEIGSFSIVPSGQLEQVAIFGKVDIARLSGESPGNGLILGLLFFKQNAVIYDLKNKVTGYTPFFVSADNFTTDREFSNQIHLGNISVQIGNGGLLGIARTVSGAGNLTLDPKPVVRMTNINTYTGYTHISSTAALSLAGVGSIEQSAWVITDRTLDVTERGNANLN